MGSSEWNKLFKKKIENLSADDSLLCVSLPDVLDLPNEYCVIETTLKYKKDVLSDYLGKSDDFCARIKSDLRKLFEDAVVNPNSSFDKYIAFNVEQSGNENTGSRASKRKHERDGDDDDDVDEDEQSANENTGSRASKRGKHERGRASKRGKHERDGDDDDVDDDEDYEVEEVDDGDDD